MIDRLGCSIRFGFVGLLLIGLIVPLTSCTSSPSLTSIAVTPTTMNFGGPGLTTQLTATGSYTHPDHAAILKDITDQVTWTSATPACVTVSSTGLITSQNATCTNILVTASAPGFPGTITGSMTVNVTGGSSNSEPLVSMAIVPATQTLLGVGQTAQFIAIGTTSSGATVDLTTEGATVGTAAVTAATWKSSNQAVATICNTGDPLPCTAATVGQAVATGAGSTTISATSKNPDQSVVLGTAALTVTLPASPEPIVSMAIVPATQTANALDQTIQFIAIGTTSSGTTVDLTKAATWKPSVKAVATICNAGDPLPCTATTVGQATALINGATAITATAPANPGSTTDSSVVSATAALTVSIPATPEPFVSLAIVPGSETVTKGQTANFLAIGTTPTGATVDLTNQVAWTSSNTSVASFNSTNPPGVVSSIASGTTAIMAKYANPGIGNNPPDGTSESGTAVLTVSSAPEPLLSVAIVPSSPSVASPGQSNQLLAIGTFSATPITQDVTSGIASYPIKTSWSSSNPSVATVTTACPSGLVATSCTISACPGASSGGSCTSCPGGTAAAGGSCATLNPTTPMGLVTGVNQGTAAIVVEAANPDNSLVTNTVPFMVVGGATEQITAVQIIPLTLTATSPAEKNQLIALGTEGSSGLQFDVTNQVVWASNNSPVASVCTAVAGVAPSPVVPISCATTPGLVTAATAGTTNITATWTNSDGSKVVAQATYTVTIGSSPEPLISINVVPTTTTVTNKGMTQQFLAFGTYTTVPTVRDITDTVTWISLSPNNVSINSAGTPGEIAGLATAQGYEGPGVIYAEDTTTNPDGTLVLSNPVTFSCVEPGTLPPICNQAVAPSLLATLTVFNAGSNSTNWLITAPSDQGVPDLIHCGPGSPIAGLGNSVCTGTYAAGTNVTITASLAGSSLDTTFGGWTANCDIVADTPNVSANCALPTPPNGGDPSGLVGNQSVGALFYGLTLACSSTTSGEVGTPFSSGAITVTNGTTPYTFSVLEPNSVPVNTLPPGLTLNTSTGAVSGTPTAAETGTSATSATFSITATDKNGTTSAAPCPITIN